MQHLSSTLTLLLVAAGASLFSCKLSNYEVEDGSGSGGSGLGGVGASGGSSTGATGTGAGNAGGDGSGATGTGAGNTGGSGTGATGGGGAANGGSGGNGGTGGAPPPYPCDAANEYRMPGGSCYAVLTPKTAWQTARDDCIAWGGDLAIVSTQAEFDFIEIDINQHVWIGLRDVMPQNGSYDLVWVDGTPLATSGFSSIGDASWRDANNPELDEDCVKLHDGFESGDCTSEPADGHLCEQP